MIGVYGANGFIGRHFVRRLAVQGVAIRAVSRRFDPEFLRSFDKSVDFVEADLRDPIAMASSLQDVDSVVQLISTSSPGLKNDHVIADIQENVIPHVEFLQTCVRAGVRRYLFLSSGGTVYGPGAPIPTPETCATNPINSHGLTKLIVEKYIQMHGHLEGLEYVILRVANPFGPGQAFRKGQGLIPAILDHWQKGLPVRIFGDGQARRDYIYVEDVINAIESALVLPSTPRLILNIGSGQVRSVTEIIAAVESATGHRFEREYVAARNTDVDIASLDVSRARSVLGWVPRTDFDEGIAKTVASMSGTGR
ncbi:NAD-dependent epimerase/dehydratase family protein [Mesorhizobium sp. M0317]|uniref:NAD-dependent epimerase/dehydratase family protein n=1 Tax=unclassified Mesorhizobium TaxID=325217 RepID=UPI0003CEC60C|nr:MULTISPECIES: NAD-dependent epimerase/dehydratase family protein [unclassified Mesorhizobium]ESY25103.1 NAD-dependent epimerase [Mesorhizobium sp. LNJC394B00]ESZ75227.1 NAD-dependent epimerase [Mesorhizobium sp. L103C105A0]